MGSRGREPSAFPALYKTSASLEQDRKPSAPEPFYSASNFLALRLAMSALTYEMLLVAFAVFLTFSIVLLFFGSSAVEDSTSEGRPTAHRRSFHIQRAGSLRPGSHRPTNNYAAQFDLRATQRPGIPKFPMATGCLLRLVTLGFQSSWFKVTVESATVRSLVDDDGRVLAKLWRGHGHTGLYRRGAPAA